MVVLLGTAGLLMAYVAPRTHVSQPTLQQQRSIPESSSTSNPTPTSVLKPSNTPPPSWKMFTPTGEDNIVVDTDWNKAQAIPNLTVSYTFQYPAEWQIDESIKSIDDARCDKAMEWPEIVRLRRNQHCYDTIKSDQSWFSYDYQVLSRTHVTVGNYSGVRDVETLDHNYAIAYCLEFNEYAFDATFYSPDAPNGHTSEELQADQVVDTIRLL